jgi:uncharacterized protein YcbK (DUF882 family)
LCDNDHGDAPVVSRRTLLAGLAGTALVTATGVPAAAATPGRTLQFFRYHSGEKLTAPYFAHHHYRDNILQEINKICRDLREKQETVMDVHLLDYVYAVAHAVDPNPVVEIISAYRTPKTNAWLRSKSTNVAKHSLHMQGRAMDIRIRGHEPEQVAAVARSMKRGGVGLYVRSGFVHLDTGSPRFWGITPAQTRQAQLDAAAHRHPAQTAQLDAGPPHPIDRSRFVGLKPSLRPDAGAPIVRTRPTVRPL